MKPINLLSVPLFVKFVVILETAGEPCSTANNLPVVNICIKDTKFQDASNSVLLKADSRLNCTCELSVINQDRAISINITSFENLKSSRPSNFGCGLILKFSSWNDIFWLASCFAEHRSSITRQVEINNVITIRSLTVNGTLRPQEGYCIEIQKTDHGTERNMLKLTCGIGSNPDITITSPSEEITTAFSRPTNSLPMMTMMTTKSSKEKMTKINGFTVSTSTSTDHPLSTRQTDQENINEGNDDTATYVTLVASAGGLSVITTILVLCCKRLRRLNGCGNKKNVTSNTIYDTLNIPPSANDADDTNSSNNYSSLNIADVQSMSDNGGLNGKLPIPLSTISIGNNINTNIENQRHLTSTTKNRCEYVNLVL